MGHFLYDLWRYTVTRAKNPLYTRELSGWTYTQFFSALRRGCLPLFLLMFGFTAVACTLPLIGSTFSGDPEALIFAPYLICFAFYMSGEVLLFGAGFLATALTATSISSEIEAQSYSLLRMTPFTPHDIVFTKYGAAMHQMRLPIVINLITRLGSIIAAVVYSVLLIVAAFLTMPGGISNPSVPTSPPPTLGPIGPIPMSIVFDSALIVGVVALLLILIVLLYVCEPTLRLAMFAAIGLLASSLSKTRTNGLIAAIFVRGGYAMMAYVAAQAIQFLLFPIFTVISLVPGLETFFITRPVLGAALSLTVIVIALLLRLLFPIAVTSGSLLLTERRARRLPFNTA